MSTKVDTDDTAPSAISASQAVKRLGNVTTIGTVSADYYNGIHATLERLANGRFAVGFETGTFGQPGQGGPSTVHTALLTSTGTSIGAIQAVANAEAGQYLGSLEIAGTSSGGYFLTYEGGPEEGGPSTGDVFGRIYSGSGAATTATFNLPSNIADGEFNNDVIRLDNGNYLVTWSDLNTAVPSTINSEIVGQVFTEAGARVGSEFTINAGTADLQLGHSTVKLANGNILVVWTEGTLLTDPVTGEPTGLAAGKLEARMVTAAGVPTGGDITLMTAAGGFKPADESGSFDVLALADGGFALAWIEHNGVPGGANTNVTFRIKLQRFDSAGTATGAATVLQTVSGVNTETQNEPFEGLELMMLGTEITTFWHDQSTSGPPAATVTAGHWSSTGAFVTTLPTRNLESGPYLGDIIAIEENGGTTVRALVAQNNGQGQITYGTVVYDLFAEFAPIEGTSFDDLLFGTADVDEIIGYDGNDRIDGLGGADTMNGGNGNDEYTVDRAGDIIIDSAGMDTVLAKASYTLAAGIGIEHLVAAFNAGAINLAGNAGVQFITGNDAANTLDGRGGADTMAGLGGNDVFNVDSTLDFVIEAIGGGSDRVQTSVTYGLSGGSEVERMDALGTANIGLTGNEFAQVLIGNAGTNVLNGLSGADTLQGLAGNDTYYVDNIGDVVIEAAGGGSDRVVASMSYTLRAGAEIERLDADPAFASAAINLNGNELNQSLVGNNGANILDGKGGADTMSGGFGNDIYFVDSLSDVVIEAIAGGIDRITASFSFSLRAGMEIERLDATAGTASINLNGNEIGQSLNGNAGANTLDGKAGADVMAGGLGNDLYLVDNAGDVVVEAVAGGTDRVIAAATFALRTGAAIERLDAAAGTAAINLTGNEFNQSLAGNSGANVLDGRGGADTMQGFGGDDMYHVDNAGDIVLEAAAGGTDRVVAALNYALRAGAEIERLEAAVGTAAIVLTGNEFSQGLVGNNGANTLNGGAGGDTLTGGLGNDVINGGTGNDIAVLSGAAHDATWTYNASGTWTLTSASGSDTLSSVEVVRFADHTVRTYRGAAEELLGDFNSDGKQDMLWRHNDGSVSAWQLNGAAVLGTTSQSRDAAWSMRAVGDFNGTGGDDILWRHDDGSAGVTYMANGNVAGTALLNWKSAAWNLAGAGDVTGSVQSDILWRHADGSLQLTVMNGSAIASDNLIGWLSADWTFQAFANILGDSHKEIIWRHTDGTLASMTTDGATVTAFANIGWMGDLWSLSGRGDFDGAGGEDFLWRHNDGSLTMWLMNSDGTISSQPSAGWAGADWQIQGVGDSTGDGKADIHWRHTDGSVSLWAMNGATKLADTSYGWNSSDWLFM